MLEKQYTVSTYWTGNKYCGLSLDWDYKMGKMYMSVPNYIATALHKLQHPTPTRPQHSPYLWSSPSYSKEDMFVKDKDLGYPTSAKQKKCIQKIIGKMLYYGWAIDLTLLSALSTLGTAQIKGGTAVMKATEHLLEYFATSKCHQKDLEYGPVYLVRALPAGKDIQIYVLLYLFDLFMCLLFFTERAERVSNNHRTESKKYSTGHQQVSSKCPRRDHK